MREASLYKTFSDKSGKLVVKCLLCPSYCQILDGDFGDCLVRQNIGGKLYTHSWGNVEGLAVDPIEKKPFFHFKPGIKALSFGTPGCNFRCDNCQNHLLSHSSYKNLKLTQASNIIKPESIVEAAIKYRVDGIAYTYSEPTIFFEMARDTILAARNNELTRHLYNIFISNGYFSKEMLEMVDKERLVDAINIDLKFMDDKKYQRITGGHLIPVLKSIERIYQLGNIHLEIINLVIPGENDSDNDLERLSDFVASVSTNIPLHFSRFYPRNKMSEHYPTPFETLKKAVSVARYAGMKYVYIGNTNIPGAEDTICPNCGSVLISRSQYGITKNVFKDNRKPICPYCNTEINIVL